MPTATLREYVTTQNFDSDTVDAVQEGLHYDETQNFDENLTRIGFGSLWNTSSDQGWYVEGVDSKAIPEVLWLALLQMTASENRANELLEKVVEGEPQLVRSWGGREIDLRQLVNGTGPTEPDDKSQVLVSLVYPNVSFTQGERTWHILIQKSQKGDGSRFRNGDTDYWFVHIDSSVYSTFFGNYFISPDM